jgi:hypothetical protein
VPQAQIELGGILKMNRRYALIALDRGHEWAEFPGCHLACLRDRGSRENKVIVDPKHGSLRKIVEQIAELALDQAPSGRLTHDDTIAPNADVETPKSSAIA